MNKLLPSLSGALNWLLPKRCLGCGMIADNVIPLCQYCYQALPWLDDYCPSCGLPHFTDQLCCDRCLKHPPHYQHATITFYYHGLIPYWIKQLKFAHNLMVAKLLGILMAERLAVAPRADIIIPVPLHSTRFKQRGYNQATAIAEPIAKALNIPLDVTSTVRVHATAAQAKLSASERQHNLAQAFVAHHRLQGKHVAIVDDVLTTGATTRALCHALRRVEVTHISIWAVAKTNYIST